MCFICHHHKRACARLSCRLVVHAVFFLGCVLHIRSIHIRSISVPTNLLRRHPTPYIFFVRQNPLRLRPTTPCNTHPRLRLSHLPQCAPFLALLLLLLSHARASFSTATIPWSFALASAGTPPPPACVHKKKQSPRFFASTPPPLERPTFLLALRPSGAKRAHMVHTVPSVARRVAHVRCLYMYIYTHHTYSIYYTQGIRLRGRHEAMHQSDLSFRDTTHTQHSMYIPTHRAYNIQHTYKTTRTKNANACSRGAPARFLYTCARSRVTKESVGGWRTLCDLRNCRKW